MCYDDINQTVNDPRQCKKSSLADTSDEKPEDEGPKSEFDSDDSFEIIPDKKYLVEEADPDKKTMHTSQEDVYPRGFHFLEDSTFSPSMQDDDMVIRKRLQALFNRQKAHFNHQMPGHAHWAGDAQRPVGYARGDAAARGRAAMAWTNTQKYVDERYAAKALTQTQNCNTALGQRHEPAVIRAACWSGVRGSTKLCLQPGNKLNPRFFLGFHPLPFNKVDEDNSRTGGKKIYSRLQICIPTLLGGRVAWFGGGAR